MGSKDRPMGAIFRGLFCIVLLTLLVACDRLVFNQGELAAREKFMSIEIGATESAAIKLFGQPHVTFTRQTDGTFVASTHSKEFEPLSTHFQAPRGTKTERVVSYLEGSVLAYFEISDSGKVLERKVKIS